MKVYKGKLIWPEDGHISVEPRENGFIIPQPVLLDKKRQFFKVPDDVLMKAKTALNIVQVKTLFYVPSPRYESL